MFLDQSYYTSVWLKEILRSPYNQPYWEPLIQDDTVKLILDACKLLKQDAHVFISSVDTLEKYLEIKLKMGGSIECLTLAAACSVSYCSKFAGGQSDLRPRNIQEYLSKSFNRSYSTNAIKTQEYDIFYITNGKIELYPMIDDVEILLVNYIKPMNLKAESDLHDLCVAILKLFYLYRNRIFDELKGTYQKNKKGFYAFTECVRKRLYFPCGILLCAFKLTKCRDFLDLNGILKELSELISVHQDHLQFLSDVIYQLVLNGVRET